MRVFIVGIAGNIGARLARLLVTRGDGVNGLYRRSEQGDLLRATGVEATHGDLVAMSALEVTEVLRGTDVLVFSAGAAGESGKAMTTAIDGEGLSKSVAAAIAAGVKRLILVSAFPEAGRDKRMPEEFEHYMAVKKRADMELVFRPAKLTLLSG